MPCAPGRELLGVSSDARDLARGSRVQESLVEARLASGDQRIGRKVGLTQAAVPQQHGADHGSGLFGASRPRVTTTCGR